MSSVLLLAATLGAARCVDGSGAPVGPAQDGIPVLAGQALHDGVSTGQAAFVPLVSASAPHGTSGLAGHQAAGAAIPRGQPTRTDDGSTLTVAVVIAGLIPAPAGGHDLYDLRLIPVEGGSSPVGCVRTQLRALMLDAAADAAGRLQVPVERTGGLRASRSGRGAAPRPGRDARRLRAGNRDQIRSDGVLARSSVRSTRDQLCGRYVWVREIVPSALWTTRQLGRRSLAISRPARIASFFRS